MSSVSSIGQNLLQYFQSVQSGSQQSLISPSFQLTGSTDTDGDSAGGSQSVQSGGHHHHGGHGGGGGLFSQIASAVTSALEGTQSSTSGTTTTATTGTATTGTATTDTSTPSVNQIIQNAIAQVLSGQGNSSTSATNGSPWTVGIQPTTVNDGEDEDNTDGAGEAGNSGNSALATLEQTLQSFGVTPQEFQQDFQAALQSINGSQSGAGLAQLLPPGSLVNETA